MSAVGIAIRAEKLLEMAIIYSRDGAVATAIERTEGALQLLREAQKLRDAAMKEAIGGSV